MRVSSRHECTDSTAPAIVAQPLSQSLGLAQALQQRLDVPKLGQHRPQLETSVESLLQHGLALRQRLNDPQRLLEPGPGVLKRPTSYRLQAGLSEVGYRSVSQSAALGVMGKPLDLLAQTIPVEHLDRVDDPRVQGAPPLLQQAAVGDLVRERMCKRVRENRQRPGLEQKLGGLEAVESTTKCCI